MKSKKAYPHLKTVAAFFLCVVLISCERDDICATTTPTTPHLIIQFYNINAPEETKTVRHMSVLEENNDTYIIYDKTVDKIALPLRLDALNSLNTTRFILTKDSDYDDDDDPNTFSNSDIITVNYTPELIYVSRACGYKSIFNDASAFLAQDVQNWIFNLEVNNSTINNEDAAHINIFH